LFRFVVFVTLIYVGCHVVGRCTRVTYVARSPFVLFYVTLFVCTVVAIYVDVVTFVVAVTRLRLIYFTVCDVVRVAGYVAVATHVAFAFVYLIPV